jgi:hypothetical protein
MKSGYMSTVFNRARGKPPGADAPERQFCGLSGSAMSSTGGYRPEAVRGPQSPHSTLACVPAGTAKQRGIRRRNRERLLRAGNGSRAEHRSCLMRLQIRVFASSNTTVKYNRKLRINHAAAPFDTAMHVKLSCNINMLRVNILERRNWVSSSHRETRHRRLRFGEKCRVWR